MVPLLFKFVASTPAPTLIPNPPPRLAGIHKSQADLFIRNTVATQCKALVIKAHMVFQKNLMMHHLSMPF